MLLGLDLGTKRTGVALGDQQVAQEYTTLPTNADLVTQLRVICQTEGVNKIIVGLPLHSDGAESVTSGWVREFGNRIEQALGVPVFYVDELLTTSEAQRQLEQSGLKPAEVAARVDRRAAKLILEQYLNSARHDT